MVPFSLESDVVEHKHKESDLKVYCKHEGYLLVEITFRMCTLFAKNSCRSHTCISILGRLQCCAALGRRIDISKQKNIIWHNI